MLNEDISLALMYLKFYPDNSYTSAMVSTRPRGFKSGTYHKFKELNSLRCKAFNFEYREDCVAFTIFYERNECHITNYAVLFETCTGCATFERQVLYRGYSQPTRLSLMTNIGKNFIMDFQSSHVYSFPMCTLLYD